VTAQNCTKSGVVVFVKKLQKFANTVDPDPDRTAEEDYQQRLIKSGGYRLQLEMQRNDLAEKQNACQRDRHQAMHASRSTEPSEKQWIDEVKYDLQVVPEQDWGPP